MIFTISKTSLPPNAALYFSSFSKRENEPLVIIMKAKCQWNTGAPCLGGFSYHLVIYKLNILAPTLPFSYTQTRGNKKL
jgi:hypothetical protein